MPDSLAAVAADVAACRTCPRLVAWREQVAVDKRAAFRDWDYWARGVPAFGDPDARIVIVGLAPAAHGANRTGRMFTGDRSGDWLYRAMWRAGLASQPTSHHLGDGLELHDALVTAPVKCAPPANKPTTEERDNCRRYLRRELALLQPAVYIALGGFGFGVLCGELGIRPRPRFGHGVEVPVPGGGTLIGCYHVSQQNTFTGKLTEAMLDAVFTRARELAGLEPHDAPPGPTEGPEPPGPRR